MLVSAREAHQEIAGALARQLIGVMEALAEMLVSAREAHQEIAGALARQLIGVMEALAEEVAAREAHQEIAGALARQLGMMQALAEDVAAREAHQDMASALARQGGVKSLVATGTRVGGAGQKARKAAKEDMAKDIAAKTTFQEMAAGPRDGVLRDPMIGETRAVRRHGQMGVARAGRAPKEKTKIGPTIGRVSLIASDAL